MYADIKLDIYLSRIYFYLRCQQAIMKAIISTLIISLLAFPAFSQSVLKTIGKSSLKNDIEFIQELSKALKVVHKDFNVQLDEQDTLYFIRGIDIQSRTA